MAWFKVDDKLHDHRKSRTAGTTAMGLWVLAGAWSADNLEDGFVPESVMPRWDKNYRKLAGQLVAAAFWTEAVKRGEKGWQFHDWSDCNPTKEQVEERRGEARERMAELRKNKRSTSPEVRANSDGTFTEVLVPVPSRPVLDVGSSGGERTETLRAVPDTAPPKTRGICSRHPNGNPDDVDCGGCRRVTEAARKDDERSNQKRADEAVQARLSCPRCEGMGFILDDDKKPTGRRCDPHLASVAAISAVADRG